MKFPSFIRLPNYKRFNINPRYYDPIKEDIEIRTEKIKTELNHTKLSNYRSNIRDSFTGKVTRDSKAGILRLSLFILIFGSFVGYLYFGSQFFYAFFLFVPVYFYFRLKNFKKG